MVSELHFLIYPDTLHSSCLKNKEQREEDATDKSHKEYDHFLAVLGSLSGSTQDKVLRNPSHN